MNSTGIGSRSTSTSRMGTGQAATVPTTADVLLADGRVAVIRALRSSDGDSLRALHDHVSDDAFRLRFFTVGRAVGDTYVEHLMSSTTESTVCLVACMGDQIVAVATAERIDPTSAEVAFLVADDRQGIGLGSLLIEHLAAQSRDDGIRRLVAEVLWENVSMLGVFRDAGFAATRTDEGAMVRVELDTERSDVSLAAADLREAQSETRSLAPILYPSHVAVVGVRRDGTGTGQAVVASIRAGGFTGRLDVVHPAGGLLKGIPAHASFCDIDGDIDLAIIAVPAGRVLDALRDAIEARVRGVVVVSSGFGELGPEGQEIQLELVRMARRSGIRIIGPNCLGVLVNDPGIHLNATFTNARPPYGGLAIASQSGGVGIALLQVATELGLGVHSFLSLGNKADVSGNDLLSAWINDPKVTAAALYLESFGNAPKFARLARRFSRTKPLLAVVGGRSTGGQRGGQSHTAAAASPSVGVDALFAQAGVIRCRGAEDMAETALLLGSGVLPQGPRVAIVSNAGGVGVLAADVADLHGLVVPEFSAELQGAMAAHVSGTVGFQNPVDIGAGGAPGDLGNCVEAVLASGEADAVLVVLVATALTRSEELLSALAAATERHPGTPVLLSTTGIEPLPTAVPGVTRFRSYEGALEALGRAVARGAWLSQVVDPAEPHDNERGLVARGHALDILAGDGPANWLSAGQVAALLGPYGLDQSGVVVCDAAHGARVASRIGYPIAAKLADPTVQHKTDRGLVRIGIRSAEALAGVFSDFAVELGRTGAPVLLQPMVAGVEIALGVVNDQSFGPIVRLAAGGTATNLLTDQAFLLPPITPRAAEEAIRSLRLWPLLDGYRGAEPCAVDALVELVVGLADLAQDVPELAELDLNPVIVTPAAAVVVDAKVRLDRQPVRHAGVPRQLGALPGTN